MAQTTDKILNALTEHSPVFHGAVRSLGNTRKEWAKKARFDWEIEEGPVYYKNESRFNVFNNRKVLYRSDTGAALSVVSNRFKVVQPADILGFFGELADEHGFDLEAAGQTVGGRRLWGLAKTPHEISAHGDKVGGYLLMVTGCDGGLSTQAFFTSIRLYCANQLRLALREAQAKGQAIYRITHSTAFEYKKVKERLSLIDRQWEEFEGVVKKLQAKKVSPKQAQEFFLKVAYPTKHEELEFGELRENSSAVRLLETYQSGKGQDDIKGSAWGLLNAVTRYADHVTKAKDGEARVQRAWFGDGDKMKQRALALLTN